MRINLFLILIFISVASSGQIVSDKKDQFTGERVIKTKQFVLANGVGGLFAAVDSAFYLIASGYNNSIGVIGETDPLIILLENQEKVILMPTGRQNYKVGSPYNIFSYMYHIDKDQVQTLSGNSIEAVRISTNRGGIDFQNKKKKDDAKKQAAALLEVI